MHLIIVLLAASEPSVTADVSRPPAWSVGGGFGFAVYDSMPMGVGYALVPNTPPPFRARVLAERRLTQGLWLMLQAQLSYVTSSQSSAQYNADGTLSSVAGGQTQEQYGGMIGVRYQFDLAGIIELSPYAMLGGAYSRQTANLAGTALRSEGGIARAQIGFAVERELVRGLSLRFSTSVVEARWGGSIGSINVGDAASPTTSNQAGVALVLEPTIDLRMRF